MTVGARLKQTIASLNGVKSTLETYALQAQSQETKEVYLSSRDVLNNVVSDLEKRSEAIEFEEPQYKGF